MVWDTTLAERDVVSSSIDSRSGTTLAAFMDLGRGVGLSSFVAAICSLWLEQQPHVMTSLMMVNTELRC